MCVGIFLPLVLDVTSVIPGLFHTCPLLSSPSSYCAEIIMYGFGPRDTEHKTTFQMGTLWGLSPKTPKALSPLRKL